MRKQSPGSKATTPRCVVQAYAMQALAANGFGDAAVECVEQRLKAAGARPRPQGTPTGLTAVLKAAMQACRDLARRIVTAWKRRRQASATYAALSQLNARTLHDLGFDRSELSSVAAEIAGHTRSDRTRAHAVQRLQRSFR